MQLKCLLNEFNYNVLSGNEDVQVNNLVYDSRKVEKGDVFVCVKGAVSDGHKYIPSIIDRTAAIIIEDEISDSELIEEINKNNVTVIKTEDTRAALAYMAAAFFEYPAKELKIIGITGTKGKTTASYMVRSMLENVGIKTGLIGTVETIIGDKKIPSVNTTPESFVLQQYFREMVKAGCKCVVMEVSSQALKLNRVCGIVFDYAIFTNLSEDHIGKNEHKDFDEYVECKSKLFEMCRHAIVNADADCLDRILKNCKCDVEYYGIDNECDYRAKDIKLLTAKGKLGIDYKLTGKVNTDIELFIPGKFSVYNSLCAIAICLHFTDDIEKMKEAIKNIRVKGRVEMVDVSDRFTLMIDYAHNAMSLESLLTSMKEYNPTRLVTIFGCGGNRSKERRYGMGEVASKLSDFTIITSDNPRDEEPMDIIADIEIGMKKADGEYITIPDRKEAVKYAIENAKDGDVIILAGKGHEDYQEIKGVKYPMDERVIIAEILEEINAK